MNDSTTTRRRILSAALAIPAGLVLWECARQSHEGHPRRAAPLPREYLDRGMDCLAMGEVRPPLAELSDAELVTMAELIGRLLHAYERGDFDSFLALRAGDLEFAALARREDLGQLRELARELGTPREELPGDWPHTLAAFWSGYYQRPPVARFCPERTRVALHPEGLRGRDLESLAGSFAALRDRFAQPWIQHQLAVPHRRDIARVARDSGPLEWLDVELGFETYQGKAGHLLVRFVWDGVLHEWFVHAAATVYEQGDRPERHLIL